MTSKTEIEVFMAAQKNAVVSMNWREKLAKHDPQWWEYVSAVEIDGVVVEDIRLIVQWRLSEGAAGEKYNCGLLYRGDRVFAVDFEPDGKHTNKIGKGRPLYRSRLGRGRTSIPGQKMDMVTPNRFHQTSATFRHCSTTFVKKLI